MTTNHTPGPWQLSNDGQRVLDSEGESQIAKIFGAAVEDQEGYANAFLIASAPDLLAALQALTEWGCTHTDPSDTNSPHELLIAARLALSKATGAKTP